MRATFGAGCFWGVEEKFRVVKGVTKTTVGYAGGDVENPSYEEVCTDATGHAEVVDVEFDENIVSFIELVKLFFSIHNPTQINRQGPDVGRQYRSVIFYHNEEQKKIAEEIMTEEQAKHTSPIATEIVPFKNFYPAEEYHQKYLMKKDLKTCE